MPKKDRSALILPLVSGAVCLMTIGIPNPWYSPQQTAAPALIPGSQPKPCFGFTPVNGKWGPANHQCPVDHALYSVGDDGGKEREGSTINVSSACCPLPSSDILTDDHVFVSEECPENFVATGASAQPCNSEYCPVLMRCTRINSERYQLSGTVAAKYWGNGHAGWRNSKRTEWEDIPAAIRYSVGRSVGSSYGADGCIGYPWGSMLTKKTSKYCGGYGFKQLQFRGTGDDPQEGTPVKMFADCGSVRDPHDPQRAACVENGNSAL